MGMKREAVREDITRGSGNVKTTDLIRKPIGFEYDGSVSLDVAALFEYCLEEIRLIIQWGSLIPAQSIRI